EHADKLLDQHLAQDTWQELDFQKLFLTQEEDDEDSATLADVLQILKKRWPTKFQATHVAVMINSQSSLPETEEDQEALREFLLPGATSDQTFSAKTISKMLKKHLDEPVRSGHKTLVLRRVKDMHTEIFEYRVDVLGE